MDLKSPTKTRFKKSWLLYGLLIAVFTLGAVVQNLGERGALGDQPLRTRIFPRLQELAGWFTNAKFRVRGAEPPRNKIVIVEIDDRAVASIARWPWHRDAMAYLIEQVFDAGAKVVGLDIIFAEPDVRVSPELTDLLREHHLEERIPEFETDLALGQTFATHYDSLVLGWGPGQWCQPAYEPAADCPVMDPQVLALQPKGYDKFAIRQVVPPAYDQARSPLYSATTLLTNMDRYNAVARHAGFLQAWPDADGFIRKGQLVMSAGGHLYPALGLEMARIGLNEDLRVEMDGRQRLTRIGFAKSGRDIPVNALGAMRVNFRGPAYQFDYVSALELVKEGDAIEISRHGRPQKASRKEIFKDAYVLIGLTALGTGDNRAYPFDPVTPGVEGHATIIDNLLAGDPLVDGSPWWVLGLMTLGALGFIYLLERRSALFIVGFGVLTLAGMLLLDFGLLFGQRRILWNTSLLYLEYAALGLVGLFIRYLREEKKKQQIHSAFSKYVAPAVVDTMLRDPTKLTVGGEKKNLTILFSDIRGFSSFSEKMDAPRVSAFLNDYLSLMTDIVFEYGGTLDKYIGDAVMAFWGAPVDDPRHAANACKAAIKMIETLDANRARYKAEYGLDIYIGIGINTGSVSVGNMGSTRIFGYTVIGDHVNLASRLEGVTKYYGCSIVTSSDTLDEIVRSGETPPLNRLVDLVKVKGKSQAVKLHQIFTQPPDAEGIALFEMAREFYLEQRWNEAVVAFERADKLLRRNPKIPDGPCALYSRRCRNFAASAPPLNWDGRWEMTQK